MRAPLSWLAEHVVLPEGVTGRALADAMIMTGIEVEGVASGAEGLSGPIVVGRVLSCDDEPQKNGKVIRWCQVDVGEDAARGIVCGAHNFAPGDLVVVSLPGAVLPGGFAISARKTYGHVSDGMICSVRELGIGDEHDGILVLAPGSATPGDDPLALLGLDDAVLDVAVTTDRGYCLSIRGLAREAASAIGAPFTDVAADIPEPDGGAYEVHIDDPTGCDRFSVMAVTGLDPAAPTPAWLANRLRQCGMRSVSLAVDVTNYVMLETGQPLHAFDRRALRGPLRARRAHAGEALTLLSGSTHDLHVDDMVVADDSGAIALAGVMGGASTEIGAGTTDIVLEAAHWHPASIARTVRRHRLPSEASKRFERDVDPEIAAVALGRCVELLVTHGGAQQVPGLTAVGSPREPAVIELAATQPEVVAGMPITRSEVIAHLRAVGCDVDDTDPLVVRPPSWRPDLVAVADLLEEVIRLAGYHRLPSVLPAAPAGRGLTARQTLVRTVSRAAAAAGCTEVLTYPFVSPDVLDTLGIPADDARRRTLRLANPLSEDEPELRTALLPGLLSTALRNIGRGSRDLAIFETGLVFLAREAGRPTVVPGIDARPSADDLAALDALLPEQPRHIGAVLCGDIEPRNWQSGRRPATWADAIEIAREVCSAARVEPALRAVDVAPWHPGRCAELSMDGAVLGYAGELHPRVIGAFGLPERTCALELDLDALPVPGPPSAPHLSSYPPVLLDVALVIDRDVPVGAVEHTFRATAGPLLESVRAFDVFTDDARLGADKRSVAFALRFRAPDRTLTVDDATALRDSAVAVAMEKHGVRLRD